MVPFPKTSDECTTLANNALLSFKQEFLNFNDKSMKECTLEDVRTLDLAYYQAAKISNMFQVLVMLHPDNNIKSVAHGSMMALNAEFDRVLNGSNKLYNVLKKYETDDSLDEQDHFYILRELRQLKSDGAEVHDKQPISEINQKVQELMMKFMANISNNNAVIDVTMDEIDKSGLHKQLKPLIKNGKLHVTSIYNVIMEQSNCQSLREKTFKVVNMIEPNNDTLNSYLELITAKSELCGFDNPAEQFLSTGCINSGSELESKLDIWAKDLSESAESDMSKICKRFGLDYMMPWDLPYYTRMYQATSQSKVSVTMPSVKACVEGMLKAYGDMLEVKFNRETSLKEWGLWSNDLMIYKVEDTSHEFLGHIVLDLNSRKGKNPQPCMIKVSSRCSMHNDSALGVVSVSCKGKKPTFKELETIAHELGHALHHVIAEAKWPSVSGSACPVDFMEITSRIFEYFVHDQDFLQKVMDTSDDLSNFIEYQQSLKVNDKLRQVMLAYVCYSYYKDGQISNAPWEEFMKKHFKSFHYDDGINMITRFVPFFSYGPKYYAYAWAGTIPIELMSKEKIRSIFRAGGGIDPITLLEIS